MQGPVQQLLFFPVRTLAFVMRRTRQVLES